MRRTEFSSPLLLSFSSLSLWGRGGDGGSPEWRWRGQVVLFLRCLDPSLGPLWAPCPTTGQGSTPGTDCIEPAQKSTKNLGIVWERQFSQVWKPKFCGLFWYSNFRCLCCLVVQPQGCEVNVQGGGVLSKQEKPHSAGSPESIAAWKVRQKLPENVSVWWEKMSPGTTREAFCRPTEWSGSG